MQLHSPETVLTEKKKDEGKCNLAKFDVNSVLCFILIQNMSLPQHIANWGWVCLFSEASNSEVCLTLKAL